METAVVVAGEHSQGHEVVLSTVGCIVIWGPSGDPVTNTFGVKCSLAAALNRSPETPANSPARSLTLKFQAIPHALYAYCEPTMQATHTRAHTHTQHTNR